MIKLISFYSRYFRYKKVGLYFYDFVGATMHGAVLYDPAMETLCDTSTVVEVRGLVRLHRGWLEAAFRFSDLLNNAFCTVFNFLKVRLELEMKLVTKKLLK